MMASEKTALRELTEKLKQEGFADIRFYIAKTRKFGLNVLDGEKEKSVRSSESVYFVEAGKDGKRCCRADAGFCNGIRRRLPPNSSI